MRRFVPFLTLFIVATAHADTFLLKSGEVVRGKLVEKKQGAYSVVGDDGQKYEIPVANVYMADLEPSSGHHLKGQVSFFSDEPSAPVKDKPRAPQAMASFPPPSPSPSSTGGIMGDKLSALQGAKDAVALSNQRNDEARQRLEEYKQIAEAK